MKDVVFTTYDGPEQRCLCDRGRAIEIFEYTSDVFNERRLVYVCEYCGMIWKRQIPDILKQWERRRTVLALQASTRRVSRARNAESEEIVSAPVFGQPVVTRRRKEKSQSLPS
jgi:hypothetical protein